MKKNIKLILGLIIICTQNSIFSADGLVKFAQSIGSPSFWKNMGTSFGGGPSGYTYSFQVLSDAHVDMNIGLEDMASFMGASFPSAKGLYNKKFLPSCFKATTGQSNRAIYDRINYYFNLYISENSDLKKSPAYFEEFIQLPFTKNDPNIYYYHIYTGKKYHQGQIEYFPAVELLGYENPTGKGDAQGTVSISNQLSSLVFFNNSNEQAKVQLMYGKQLYNFTLEKNSFNTLSVPMKKDDKTTEPIFSLRPNTLSFSVYNDSLKKYEKLKDLVLPLDGFNGFNYTIELFSTDKGHDLCIQGLLIGNYDPVISLKSRNLTPCPSTFWYKSTTQSPVGDGFIDVPGQVWIAYQGTDSLVLSKVLLGQVVAWNLVRPLVSEKNQYVYFIYVATQDDTKAKQFVKDVLAGKIGKDQLDHYNQAININAPSTKFLAQHTNSGLASPEKTLAPSEKMGDQHDIVTGNLSSTQFMIENKDLDLYGYVVGIDVFTPQGVGTGTFYYVLPPLVININNLIQFLSGCIDSSQLSVTGNTNVQGALNQQITNWLSDYMSKPQDVENQIQDYFIKYGNATITSKGALTDYGKKQLESFIKGPMSVKYPPMKLSTVLNQYVYDFGKSKPDKMPDAITNIEILDNL